MSGHGDLHIHVCLICYRNWDCADPHCGLPRSSECGECDDPEIEAAAQGRLADVCAP
jgi:hypothetical protein